MTKTKTSKSKKEPIAVALSYQDDGAPRVSAVGKLTQAKLVSRVARRYGIPVRKNTPLASKLSEIETNTEIPTELYDDVAKVLVELEDYEDLP